MAESSGGGESTVSGQKTFCRLFRVLALYCGLAILIAWIVLNLCLISPWATSMAESKLEERTGLEWEIASMSWSPWNGFRVNDLRGFIPDENEDPVVAIDHVSVRPHWKPLLRGELQLREVIADSPRIELALEMLSALSPDAEPRDEPPPIPPALAATPAQIAPPKTGDQSVAQSSLAAYAETERQAASLPPALARQEEKVVKPVPQPAPRPAAALPMRVQIKNASMRLFSKSKEMDLFNVDSFSLDLPVSGEDAVGSIKMDGLSISGMNGLPAFEQEVVWKRPRLEIEDSVVDLGEIKLRMRVQLAIKNAQSGLPFMVDMAIQPQQVGPPAWLEKKSMHVSAEVLAARLRLLGLLKDPLSWKAEAIALGEGVTVQAGHGRPRVTFDSLYIPAILQQGKLHWMGVRILGEDFAILGNGRLSMRGGLVCVTRLVAAPEVAEVMEKSIKRAGMADTWWWYNLVTPDRKVRDLTISGSVLNPLIDAGPNHAAMPLSHLIQLILHPGRENRKLQATPSAPESNAGQAPAKTETKNDENH